MALGTNCFCVGVEDFAALQLKIPFFWICDAVSWVDKCIGFSVFEDKDTDFASKHQDPITHYGGIFLVDNNHRHTTYIMCQYVTVLQDDFNTLLVMVVSV
jgi:hypothetical protein